jgi:cytochrome c556
MNRAVVTLAIAILGVAACAQEPAPETATPARKSILELMQNVVTPATDTIWGAVDPQTDAEWQVLDDAAVTVLDTFESIRTGGGGPNDDSWAADPAFQAFIDQELAAVRLVRAAISSRDMDRLFDAGNELYTPCEACHLDFNPAVIESQQPDTPH